MSGVSVNEQVETLFLVDTGATLCVLTKATATHLGLRLESSSTTVKIHTASGTIEAPLITSRPDSGRRGGGQKRGGGHPRCAGPPPAVGGLLGLSFLNRVHGRNRSGKKG